MTVKKRPASGAQAAYLGIGSNLNPEEHVPAAIAQLQARVEVRHASGFYISPAFHPDAGAVAQPPFINGVVGILTRLPPLDLKFGVLRSIEAAMGRKRTGDRYAPRAVDLDLLVYGSLWLDSAELVLPDPEVFLRSYWAVPLAELLPELADPVSGFCLRQIVRDMAVGSLVRDEGVSLAVQEAVAAGRVRAQGQGKGFRGRGQG